MNITMEHHVKTVLALAEKFNSTHDPATRYACLAALKLEGKTLVNLYDSHATTYQNAMVRDIKQEVGNGA